MLRGNIVLDPGLGDAFVKSKKYKQHRVTHIDYPLPSTQPHELRLFLLSNEGQLYKAGFYKTVSDLADWVQTQELGDKKNALIQSRLRQFKQSYIDYNGSDVDLNKVRMNLYHHGPGKLNRMLAWVISNEIAPVMSARIIFNLFDNLNVCGPAIYTHLISAEMQLCAMRSPHERWAYFKHQFCQQLAKELIVEYNKTYTISNLSILEIHYINAVCNSVQRPLNIPLSDDLYINHCDKRIINHLIVNFKSALSKRLTPKSLIDSLLEDYYFDLNVLLDNLKIDCRSTTKNYINSLNLLGRDDFFNINDMISYENEQFSIAWDAAIQLKLTCYVRLCQSGILKNSLEVTTIDGNEIHYSGSNPIQFAYVITDGQSSKPIPLITFLISHAADAKSYNKMERLISCYSHEDYIQLLNSIHSFEQSGLTHQPDTSDLQGLIVKNMIFKNGGELLDVIPLIDERLCTKLINRFSASDLTELFKSTNELAKLINLLPNLAVIELLKNMNERIIFRIKPGLLSWLRSIQSQKRLIVLNHCLHYTDISRLIEMKIDFFLLELNSEDRLSLLYNLPPRLLARDDIFSAIKKFSSVVALLPSSQRLECVRYLLDFIPTPFHIHQFSILISHLEIEERKIILNEFLNAIPNHQLQDVFHYPHDMNHLLILSKDQQLAVINRFSPRVLSDIFTPFCTPAIVMSINQSPRPSESMLLIALLRVYRYRRTQDERQYTSCWGRFFGYSREEKLREANNLEVAITSHTTPGFFNGLTKHQKNVLNQGKLGQLFRAAQAK